MISFPVTKNLASRKKKRKLQEELRIMIEKEVFKSGIPQSFLDKNLPQMVVLVLKALVALKVHESGGNNRGHNVGLIQSVIGKVTMTGDGLAWCMSTMQCVICFIEDYLQLESPVPADEWCIGVLEGAKNITNLVTSTPHVGQIFVGEHFDKNGHFNGQGHTGGIVNLPDARHMDTVEGNTSSGNARDGDMIAENIRSIDVFGNLKIRGFIYLWPNNQVPA